MFILPAQFLDCLLVDSLKHVRPRYSNGVLSDYFCVHVDYHYQWLVAIAQVLQSLHILSVYCIQVELLCILLLEVLFAINLFRISILLFFIVILVCPSVCPSTDSSVM